MVVECATSSRPMSQHVPKMAFSVEGCFDRHTLSAWFCFPHFPQVWPNAWHSALRKVIGGYFPCPKVTLLVVSVGHSPSSRCFLVAALTNCPHGGAWVQQMFFPPHVEHGSQRLVGFSEQALLYLWISEAGYQCVGHILLSVVDYQ